MKAGHDLAFIVDVTCHFNDLNLKLQGKGQFIRQLSRHIKTFQNKLQLWENQLCNGDCFHFPTLVNQRTPDYATFADELLLISKEFSDRFQIFQITRSKFPHFLFTF